MDTNNKLPIINVTKDNLNIHWSSICSAIKDSSFVAVDCELTGLGDRSKLNCSEVDLRYAYTSELVKSHAIISLGISCFTCKTVSDNNINQGKGSHAVKSQNYQVQTYNILVQPDDDYTVEAISLKFLANHGFDFNLLFTKGLLYHRGSDQSNTKHEPSVRYLFSLIIKHKKPLVIHNGFIDLMYIYQCFYCDLPKKIDTFAADLYDLFPNGIYDTKYITESMQRLPATYLEYLYKKMQLKNSHRKDTGDWHLNITLSPFTYDMADVDWHDYLQIHSYSLERDDDGLELCECYAFHGWCQDNPCDKSHDINKIVKQLNPKPYKKRNKQKYIKSNFHSLALSTVIQREIKKMKNQNDSQNPFQVVTETNDSNNQTTENDFDSSINEDLSKHSNITDELYELSDEDYDNDTNKLKSKHSNVDIALINSQNGINSHSLPQSTTENINTDDSKLRIDDSSNKQPPANCAHTAGFDAFMTGYLFASFVSIFGTLTEVPVYFTPQDIGMENNVNNVYLVGKPMPFLIRRGSFAKNSAGHASKIKTIRT